MDRDIFYDFFSLYKYMTNKTFDDYRAYTGAYESIKDYIA